MFGNSKPFGVSSTFGTSTFGSTSSPFGQSSTTFGAKPPGTNVFGTPAFGTSTPSTGSLFGTNTPTTGAGLFGQTTTAFGQPSSTSSGTFGFGNTSTSGSLFGTNTQQTPSAGLFGSSSTSAFGTPQPTFGGFGGTSTGAGLFGQSTSTGTNLFGSTTGFNAATNGTTIKFNPPTGTDTMMKGGVSTNISTRHQCITCMKEYENKSLEELRMEDYAANRKGPQAGISGFGNTGQTGLFGAPASTSAFSFGNTQTKPLFGNTTTNTFGSTGTGLFGQTPQQQSTGMFGKPVGFGTTTTSSGSTFSFGNTSGTSLFGQNNQQKPLFGQPTGGSGLFGSTATTQPSTGFGTGTGFGGFGTTPQQSTGLFGTKPTGFGTTNTTTTNTFTFGNTSNLGSGLFGQKPAAVPSFGTSTGFGTPSTGFGSFGTTQTPSTGLFGQTKPSTGFGATGSTFNTGLGTGFGSSPFSMGLGTNTGTGLFGGSTANKTTGFSFGNAGSSGFSFNQTGTSNPGFNFGPTTAVGMGSDPNASALIQQQLQVQQQILALATNPFGDSHLFRNAIKETNKREEVLKPTNPSAQKALLSNNQYKVSPLPTAKIKPKPIQPIPNGKVSLFDGLEDEEPNLRDDTFVPRRSVKKLVLKQRSPTESLLLTSSISNSISRPSELSSNILTEISPVRKHLSNKTNSPPTTPLTIDITDRCTPSVNSVPDPKQKTNTSSEGFLESSISQDVHTSKASLNSSLDDTFEALHTRGSKHTGKGLGVSFTSDSNESDRDTSQTIPDSEQNKDNLDPNLPDTSHPTGIVLKRYGYYTIPSLDEMIPVIDEDKNCFVKNFTIGREGYGKVSFPGLTNVAGLNLDEIVHFRSKEITIYPDDDNKPQIGEGLNRKAEVTLDCVWPVDKTNHAVIKDPERLQLMGYKERIEKATARLDAKFIDYRPETGSWVFQVQHFSKYGLEDSDEECDETKNMPQLPKAKIIATNSQPLQALQVINGPVAFTSIVTSQSQQQKPSRFPAMDEDDEMEDITSQGYPKELERLEKETRLISDEESYTPARQLVAALGVNAQRIQGMKASFFQEEMEEDTWAIPTETEVKKNCIVHVTQQKTTEQLGRPLPKRQATADSPHYEYLKNKSPYDHLKEGLTSIKLPSPALLKEQVKHPVRTLSAVTTARTELLSAYPVISTGTVPHVASAVQTSISGVSRKVILKPLAHSLCYNKQKQIADVGYFMGRKFRTGWGPNWTVLHLGPAIGNSPPHKNLKKTSVFSIMSQPNSTPVQPTPFSVSIEKVQLTPNIPADNIIEENLEQSLKVQLEHSASTFEEGSPVFVPKPGTYSLHAHSKLSQKHLTDIDPKHTDAGFVKQCNHVWELCVSLWGDIPGIDKGQNVSSYTQQMARRDALSKWLVKTTKDRIKREINNSSYDNKGYLSTIFNHLTGQQISEACLLAQESHDHRLALLLAQAGANPIVRRLISKQLVNWEHCKADELINSKRLKIYSLLAGALVWDSSDSRINCCENLDWKRSLALHLWYHCNPCSSVQDAVIEYDKAFQGTGPYGQYTQPPYPPYLEKEPEYFLEIDGCGDTNFTLYDTCYHLLKLYCDRSHRLDKLLIPSTSTPVHLDHRLSWLLHQTLISLGYHHLPQNIAYALHCNFASQLETMDMWHWAVYVLLHITDPQRRIICVKELLLRHVSINQDQQTQNKEHFLHDQLMVPKEWIFEAKAIKAHSLGQPADEAWYLLKAGFWNKSHNIIIAYLAADAIINENYDYLLNFLNELAPVDRHSTILDWTVGGQVFLDYIHISQMVNSVVKGDVSAYDLEKLQPEVVSLCYRLSSLRCPTAKDRLCQSEMSKKTATLLRAVLTLQQERSEHAAPTYMLTPHINNLPMPEDYALQELRVMAHSYLLALTSE